MDKVVPSEMAQKPAQESPDCQMPFQAVFREPTWNHDGPGVLNGKEHCGLKIEAHKEKLPLLLQACCWKEGDPGRFHDNLKRHIECQSSVEEEWECSREYTYGTTALMVAASNGCVDSVNLLVGAYADDGCAYVNKADDDGCTALMMAARWGNPKSVQRLLDARADPTPKECNNWTALLYAARHSFPKCAELLLKAQEGVIPEGTFKILIERGLDSVLEFLVEQLIATGFLVAALAERHLSRLCFLIERPGQSGKLVLEEIFKEQHCPVKYKIRYMPRVKPLTHMSNHKDMPRATAIGEDCFQSLSARQAAVRQHASVHAEMELLLRDQHQGASALDVLCRAATGQLEYNRKSHVTLMSCPVKGIVNRDIIASFAHSPSDEPLTTELARGIIEHAWVAKFLYIHLLDCLVGLLHLVSLCSVSSDVRSDREISGAKLFIIFVALFKRTTEELCEMSWIVRSETSRGVRRKPEELCPYFLSFGNILDWVHGVLDWLAFMYLWPLHGTDKITERTILGIVCVLQWGRLLWRLRAFESIGPRIYPVLLAVKDTLGFAVVVAFGLAAATHFYYVIGTRDEPSQWYAAFVAMYRLVLLGDFDLFELEGEDPVLVPGNNGAYEPQDPHPTDKFVLVHGLFYSVSLVLTIGLMNLLVGILGSNYERYDDNSLAIFLRGRAEIITTISCRPWFPYNGCEIEWDSKYLWLARKESYVQSEANTRAMVRASIEPLSKSLKQHQELLKERLSVRSEIDMRQPPLTNAVTT